MQLVAMYKLDWWQIRQSVWGAAVGLYVVGFVNAAKVRATWFGADGCADDGCASKKNQLGAVAARTSVALGRREKLVTCNDVNKRNDNNYKDPPTASTIALLPTTVCGMY
jgi:hypothetical protein